MQSATRDVPKSNLKSSPSSGLPIINPMTAPAAISPLTSQFPTPSTTSVPLPSKIPSAAPMMTSQALYAGQSMPMQTSLPMDIPLHALGSLAASINLSDIQSAIAPGFTSVPVSAPIPVSTHVPTSVPTSVPTPIPTSSAITHPAPTLPPPPPPPTTQTNRPIPAPYGFQLNLSQVPPESRPAAIEYDVFVSELTFNSKDIINNLTRVAHENYQASYAIATVIVQRIITSSPDRKLPVLYLLDSICKNVGEPYISNFSSSAARVFLNAYRLAGQSVRASMQRLLNTWVMVFGPAVVDSIRRGCIPLDAAPVSGVHVNPAVAGVGATMNVAQGARPPLMNTVPTTLAHTNQPSVPGTSMPLMAAPPQLPSGNMTIEAETNHIVNSITTKVLKGLPPNPSELARLSDLLTRQLETATPDQRQKLLALRGQVAALTSSAQTAAATPQTSVKYPTSWKDVEGDGYKLVVKGLYDEMEHVSKTDGMRFGTLEDLRVHMDWLFKRNRLKRTRATANRSRCWYSSFDKFLKPEEELEIKEIESLRESSNKGVGSKSVEMGGGNGGEQQVPASGEEDEKCPVCLEKFESVWDDHEQGWMLRDAKKVDGVTYHVKCAPGNTPRVLTKRRREEDDDSPGKEEVKALKLEDSVQ